MPFWPFKRRKQDDSYFTSTAGAQVVPAAPPVVAEGGGPDAAAPSAPSVRPEVMEQLAAAGIHLDPNAKVQVETHTTQLTGEQAAQFLGQLGAFLGAAGTNVQVHPQVNIVADGRLQESPEELKTHGLDAQATVKDLEDKLAMDGDLHVVKLRLEVRREGADPYEVTTGAIVPAAVTEQFAEGKTFPAKVDPKDQDQVLVLWPDSS
jgi:hypothetical protein